MTPPRMQAFTVLKDTSPLRAPTDRDVLGSVLAPDRRQARRTAERLHPGVAVVVISAYAWPVEPCPEGCPCPQDSLRSSSGCVTGATPGTLNPVPFEFGEHR